MKTTKVKQYEREASTMSKSVVFATILACLVLFATVASPSQTTDATPATTTVPRLVRYAGMARDLNNKPITGVVGVTFALYAEQTGGSPLWLETQNVQADANGHYSVLLGSTKPDGLPAEIFASEQARWIGVQVEQQLEQPRSLLVSAPYALKAGDAETLGGLPPSAFVLANAGKGSAPGTRASASSTSASATPLPPANPAVTGKGTVNFVPMWDTTNDIVNSVIFQKSGAIGIGTTTPAAAIDVNGKSDVRDTLTLFPKGTDPTLAVNGTAFKVDQAGNVTFISGQTFPGAGTIKGVTTSGTSGLQGGGTTGTLNLSVKPGGISNTMLQNSQVTVPVTAPLTGAGAVSLGGKAAPLAITPCAANQGLVSNGSSWSCAAAGTITGVTAGADLTGGGTGGNVTLNLDTSKVPLLAANNAFTGSNVFFGTQDFLTFFGGGMTIGDAGCGIGFPGAGIGFAVTLSNCNNYSLLGDGTNTFLNRPTGGTLYLREGNSNEMTISPGGRVGVGTQSPQAQLDVAAPLLNGASAADGIHGAGVTGLTGVDTGFFAGAGVFGITKNSGQHVAGLFQNTSGGDVLIGRGAGGNTFRVDGAGNVFADGIYQAGGADFAESFAVSGVRSGYKAGNLLVVDDKADRRLAISSQPYSTLVAGIYSTKPGLLGSPHKMDDPSLADEIPLAVVGIVPCMASAENGPIQRGDLLVTSSTPGHAMKGTDRNRMLGAVVGKALEPLAAGTGVIQVLVTLQ